MPAPEPHAIPLFLSEIVAMGGAERSVLALARWLHAHNRPVTLLTYHDRINLPQHAGFPLPTLALNPSSKPLAKILALRRHLAARPAGAPPPLTSGYQPALHCALAGPSPFHCLMHDTPSLFAPAQLPLPQRLRLAVSNRLIGRAMRRRGGQMIVTSQFLQAECQRDFGLHAPIARMGGLTGQHTFRRRPVSPASPGALPQLNLLSVCRLEPNKRLDWLLDALATLEHAPVPLSHRADWRLDLAGAGPARDELLHQAQRFDLARRVHLHGFVPDAQLEDLYARAHLFLMPAVQGYGIPAIEALARGIPVLLHRDSGVSDLLLDTPWATVLTGGPENLVPQLATTLNWLLTNQHLTAPPPPSLPTEDTWAEQVANLCGYV